MFAARTSMSFSALARTGRWAGGAARKRGGAARRDARAGSPLTCSPAVGADRPRLLSVRAAFKHQASQCIKKTCARSSGMPLRRAAGSVATFRAPYDSMEARPEPAAPPAAARSDTPVVNSHSEWDPLEEVIVGRVEGATVPEWHVSGKAVWPEAAAPLFRNHAGEPFPQKYIDAARDELDGLAATLEGEGVVVRRPDVQEGDFATPVVTPDFETPTQLYAAMPRDVLLVLGNEILEAPMSWRSRFFEYRPFRALVKEYFTRGGMWTAAPKPQMSDDLYQRDDYEAETGTYVSTEFEPVFDAADFTRMGRDIFAQRSQTTNLFGIQWLQRHLDAKNQGYKIHVLDFQDKNAMHIDGTFVPLAPGKVLACPKRPCVTGEHHSWFTYDGESTEYRLPAMFKGWDVFIAPKPRLPDDHPLWFTSPWTASCNVLLLGNNKVVCEANEPEVIQAFKDWGFDPIPVPFRNFLPFGGSFHCATADVRRRGELQSYF